MLGLGVAAIIGANVAFGWHYGPIGVAVSAWPAVAFLGSVELLARMTRRPKVAATAVEALPVVETVAPVADRRTVVEVAPVVRPDTLALLDALAAKRSYLSCKRV